MIKQAESLKPVSEREKNTTKAIYKPSRLAGTISIYSNKAMPQLMRIAFHNGKAVFFKLPYQAKVIKMLEAVRSFQLDF
jgi:hypothetical protein